MYIPKAAVVGALALRHHGKRSCSTTAVPSSTEVAVPTSTESATVAPQTTAAPTTTVVSTTAAPTTTAASSGGLDYTIPSSWTIPDLSNSTYDTLQATAQNAINVMKSSYWPDPTKVDFGWGTGTTIGALAFKDNIASTSDNKDFVKSVFAAAKANNANFDPYGYDDDSMWWGTSAAYCHRTYGDSDCLGWAQDFWNWVQPSQITADQAAAGQSSARAGQTIQSTCNGGSMAGAVFWRSQSGDQSDMGVNVITTSLFLTLSSYLAEATNDTKYIDAAKLAYQWITTVMMQADPNIPYDGISTTDCSANGWIFTYNTGKFVEGSVILSAVTGDDTYKNQALKTVVDAVTKVTNWNDLTTGEITEGQDGDPSQGNDGRQFKSIYVRALTEVSRREYQNHDLHALLKAYININYNDLTTKSTDGNGNYGLKWAGPYDGAYLSSEMNALDLLNAGIEFNWVR